MAPKSALLTAGDAPDKKKVHIPRKPLTTQGKILKAQADKEKQKKNQPCGAPPGSVNALQTDAQDPSSKKKPKLQSFAPPDETAEHTAILASKPKDSAAARRGWNPRSKPLTTQAKIARAQALLQTKGRVSEDLENHPVHTLKSLDPDERQGRQNVPGLMTILKLQDQNHKTVEHTKGDKAKDGNVELNFNDLKIADEKKGERSVLVRPTQRAIRVRAQFGVKEWPAPMKKVKGKQKGKAATGLFDLPEEVRARIWRYAVVDDNFFIWPLLPSGREQPDLAMTSRTIRKEVLPVYYGCNTFGISLNHELQRPSLVARPDIGIKPFQKPLTGLAAMHKWASWLEGDADGGPRWLSLVRSWAFDYVDPNGGAAAASEEDDSFVVSLRRNSGDTRKWKVKVHKEAVCITRPVDGRKSCMLQDRPSQLEGAVTKLQKNGVSAKALYEFAKQLREISLRLAGAACIQARS